MGPLLSHNQFSRFFPHYPTHKTHYFPLNSSSYWGLPGLTNATFRVRPEQEPESSAAAAAANTSANAGGGDEAAAAAAEEGGQGSVAPVYPYGEQEFVRTGLLGFLGPVRKRTKCFFQYLIFFAKNFYSMLTIQSRFFCKKKILNISRGYSECLAHFF